MGWAKGKILVQRVVSVSTNDAAGSGAVEGTNGRSWCIMHLANTERLIPHILYGGPIEDEKAVNRSYS